MIHSFTAGEKLHQSELAAVFGLILAFRKHKKNNELAGWGVS